VQQVCQLTRTTQRDGQQTADVQYAISSVPRQRADARRLLTWWRGLWHIENRVHYVRDVTMAEDACRVRTGSAPQVLSGIRNAAISLLRALGFNNIAEATREFAWKPQRLSVILGKWNN
jgi:predicted transposase YbfD/YdcC